MQPHFHSKVPVSVQTIDVSGPSQTDQRTLWGNLSRGSNTPLLPTGPLVQDPWGELVSGIECEVGGKPPWCPVAWGSFLQPRTTHQCRARSGWSLVACGHPLFAWVSYCLSACEWNLVSSHCLSAHLWSPSPPPLTPHYLMIMCWLCALMSSLPLPCVPQDSASQKTGIGWCVRLFWILRWWGIHCLLFADTHYAWM